MDDRAPGGLLFGAGTSAAAALAGSLASRRAPQVYERLRRPRWAPPAGAFGPVWTVLYAATGAAGRRLWARRAGRVAVGLHTVQLALNAAWPLAFFTARNRTAALAVIAALDAAVTAEVAVASRHDRLAAALLVPYLAWLGYATALTAAVGDPGTVRTR